MPTRKKDAPPLPLDNPLAEIRRRAGLTQAEMGDLLGRRQPTISGAESGSNPSLATLRAWARAVGFEIDLRLRRR
jgi:transcriptional regulator with XRE-family HTH domain